MNWLIFVLFAIEILKISDSKSISEKVFNEHHDIDNDISNLIIKSDYYDKDDEISDKTKHKTHRVDFFGNSDSTFDHFSNKDIIFGKFKFSSIILPHPPGRRPMKKHISDSKRADSKRDPFNDVMYDPDILLRDDYAFKAAFPFVARNPLRSKFPYNPDNPRFPFAPAYSFDMDFDAEIVSENYDDHQESIFIGLKEVAPAELTSPMTMEIRSYMRHLMNA